MSTVHGWNVTDLHNTQEIVADMINETELITYTIQTRNLVGPAYWTAPEPYVGNKVRITRGRYSL